MFQTVRRGTKAVSIYWNYPYRFECRLYVNVPRIGGLEHATPTEVARKFRTSRGALNWARKVLDERR